MNESYEKQLSVLEIEREKSAVITIYRDSLHQEHDYHEYDEKHGHEYRRIALGLLDEVKNAH